MFLQFQRIERTFLVFVPRTDVADEDYDVGDDVEEIRGELQVSEEPHDAGRGRAGSEGWDVILLGGAAAVNKGCVGALEGGD